MIRLLLAITLIMAQAAQTARAVEATPVGEAVPVIDLGPTTELHLGEEGTLAVSTAPDADGIVQRIEVRAASEGTRHWAVVGLTNPGNEQIDRLLVAPHQRLVGSGVLSPDLGGPRIAAITPSEGFPPQRVDNVDADVFRLTLDPGATVTYVVELTSPSLPMLRLWEPSAYRESQNAYTLYKGIVSGIAGLLALFLLVTFVIKGSVMFAAAALTAWVVFGYVLVDFSFLADVVARTVPNVASLRAFAEAMLVLALAAFVVSYLNITRWRLRNTTGLLTLLALGAGATWLAPADPALTAGIARTALPVVAVVGLLAILVAAVRGHDRGLTILPTWALLIAWIVGAGLTVTGRIDNDFVQPALNGGLVLLVLLIAFTVMQHAFASTSISSVLAKDVERDVLALAGSGDIVWDWDVERDRIVCGDEAEHRLGLAPGALQGPPQDWFAVLHSQDRDRFRATLDALVEEKRGRVGELFRLRGVDGHFRWFRLSARPVVGSAGEIVRCVGTLADVTEAKTVEERLLHDSVYDNLTGLPNRTLLLDRIEMARAWSDEGTAERLFVAVINPDGLAEINDQYGQSVGDSVLITIARRVGRTLKPHDTLARLSGDGFGLLIYCDPADLEAFTGRVREVLRAPIEFADEEIAIRVSIGIASVDLEADSAAVILDNAELALRRAKRQGGDRSELFDPLMRRLSMTGRSVASDLKRAIEDDRIRIEFRPVRDLSGDRVSGYEALPTWHHPLQGPLGWPDLLALAAREEMATHLAFATLDRCARTLAEWREGGADLALMLTVPSPQAFRSEIVGEVKTAIARHRLERNALAVGVPETMIADNPELAAKLLARMRDGGASTWIVDFARGTSALNALPRLAVDGLRFADEMTAVDGRTRRRRVAEALFALAQAMEFRTMVGGVTTMAAAKEFAAMGAHYAVGPAFGRPLTAKAAPRAVVEHAAAAE